MTIRELIEHADDISPNQYSTEQKVAWLSAFDGKVWREVIQTHECGEEYHFSYDGYTETEEELLIPEPYALDVYSNYLLAKIAEANAEIAKYNLYSTLFNTEYQQYICHFHRMHRPSTCEGGWKF